MLNTPPPLIYILAHLTFTLIALGALLWFGRECSRLLQAWLQKRQAEQAEKNAHTFGMLAPHQNGAPPPDDMPQLDLVVNLMPMGGHISFNSIMVLKHIHSPEWQPNLAGGFDYAHPDGLFLTLSHQNGKIPPAGSLEPIYILNLEVHLPCRVSNQTAVSALLHTADHLAERLNAKPCAAHSRSRLTPEQRQHYYTQAQAHQSAFYQWQREQLPPAD